ncbi:MAG: hypothetical protein IT379_18575 [Deltaproteobacteria bacterium]|nr:hypothetical protein [Deltaproteobacteria bacterium]
MERVLVAGVSRAHDAIVAATLEGLTGRSVESVPVPGVADLAAGRALLPRGFPLPTTGLAGALVSHVRRLRAVDPRPSPPTPYVVYAGSAPGLGSDYRVALERAGLDGVDVVALGLDAGSWTAASRTLGIPLQEASALRMLDAIAIADVVVRRACEARARSSDGRALDAIVHRTIERLATCLHEGRDADPILAAFDRALRARRVRRQAASVRVRLVGDAFVALTDGPLGSDVTRWLEARGAQVEPPAVTAWVTELAHRAGLSSWVARARTSFAARAAACGVERPRIDDPAEIDRLVAQTCGRSVALPIGAHVALGGYLATRQHRAADLVVALDGFACTVSTAIGAAVAHSLARRTSPRFLAVELSGDVEAQIESRLDLALDLARGDAA